MPMLLETDPAQVRQAISEHMVLALEVATNAAGKMRPGGTLVLMGGTGAPSSSAACLSRSGLRPVRMTSAPSARARRAVSSPMPALPPITTTVCPTSAGSRWVERGVVALVTGFGA
jgi:hypothetical protein